MKFSVCHDSRLGGRHNNQDRHDWVESGAAVLLVVADGMGGHRHGEVAAQTAVQTVVTSFRQETSPRLDDPGRFLMRSILNAHAAINDYAALRAIPMEDAPRTTCVACVIQDGQAIWAHVGDSRLYHLRHGAQLSRTKDHSRVQMLIDAGEITEEEAQVHPHRNLVYTCLGGDVPPRIDLSGPARLDRGDLLLLCSDGVWSPAAEYFAKAFSLPLERAVPLIMDEAEAVGGPGCDNLTLIALRWDAPAFEPDKFARTQPLSAISTMVESFATATLMTEAEIERSIAEIRRSILSQKIHGAT